jgi:hypothetical protein
MISNNINNSTVIPMLDVDTGVVVDTLKNELLDNQQNKKIL